MREKSALLPKVDRQYSLRKNLRLTAQFYTPSLLGMYASGWRRFSERRRTYRLSKKIKVLMGPAWGSVRLHGTRGWNIDPIVDHLNRHSKEFVCDTFVSESELLTRPVDIVFICKFFEEISLDTLRTLKKRGVRFIFSIVDNSRKDPMCYLDYPEYMELFDHFKLANPAQEEDISGYGVPSTWLPTPIVNTQYKSDYSQGETLRLIWNGFQENLEPMKALYPVVKDVAKETGIQMEIVLNTNLPASYEDGIRVIPWSLDTWEDVMVSSDIALVIKPRDDFFQQRKPPTKVLTYMAAGLPTVCTPSLADEKIIQQGKTAYAAYSLNDWKLYLTLLAESMEQRRTMGQAAREWALSHYSISKISHVHEKIFRGVLQ